MTKKDIAIEVANRTDINKTDTQKIIESFMDAVKYSLIDGENVYLRNFGTFQIKHRAETTGRNISENTTVIVPAHNIPAFKPSKSFAEEVKNNLREN